jgi:DNA modification methylase
MGVGTTALAAQSLARHFVGIEIQEEYVRLAQAALDKQNGR